MVESIKEVNTVVQVGSAEAALVIDDSNDTIADTNHYGENTAEPLQMGQGKVDGKVLFRRSRSHV